MATLKVTKVSDRLTVSSQPTRETCAVLAPPDVKLVINNRPDNEGLGQLDAATAAVLAAEGGKNCRNMPIRLPNLSVVNTEALSDVVGARSGPVRAHCRTGVRSVTLWALAEVMAGRLAAHPVGIPT